jgi:DNA-binding PadR family transcriptional regulator
MKIKDIAPRGFLTACILKSLKNGSKHGYELIKSIKEETGWEPSPGAVYPTLHHLKKQGLIDEEKNERRISYKLTIKGKEMTEKIEENMKNMKEKFSNLIGIMGQILGIKDSELERMMNVHGKKEDGGFLLLTGDIRKQMVKTRELILKITKDKKKHKNLKNVLDELYLKLKKLDGERFD